MGSPLRAAFKYGVTMEEQPELLEIELTLITVDAGWLAQARENATPEVAAMIDNAIQNGMK